MENGKRKKVSYTPILNLLAKNVRIYRGKLKMSQERLAELADLHPTYIINNGLKQYDVQQCNVEMSGDIIRKIRGRKASP